MNGFIKYPRTPHLPWSPGATSDDAYLADCGCFAGREVVVTEKMDGENTTLYRGGLHARSPDSRHHPSRDWVKALHGSICAEIPEGWRLCGENVYARHSVAYAALDSYFYLFSVWDGSNQALGWDETAEWASLLGLSLAPVLWRGAWDEATLRSLAEEIDTGAQEGYVVRVADGFGYDGFSRSLAKWVRPHHVQTDQHWMHAPVVPNELKPPGEDESES